MSKELERFSQRCTSFAMREIHGLLSCYATHATSNGNRSTAANAEENHHKKKKKKKKTVRGEYEHEYDSHTARREFQRATSMELMDQNFTNHECLPSLDSAYERFKQVYATYGVTHAVDELREREYGHLQSGNAVCMDYCGFGLFSQISSASASFRLDCISADLPSQALYGNTEQGTMESDIRSRIMQFMRTQEKDYKMVFSASRGSAFRLLAEYYPFHLNRRLLTVYDYESEGLNWMVEGAEKKGAKHMSAQFKWPSLRICPAELRKVLIGEKKKKKASAKGLFVFPVQSRVTGAKYSFQWIAQAQQNGWHVLLDASALGPKDMDSLGLSLFLPDFVICSFYRVYGQDPTGFGCLFIQNSRIACLQASSPAKGIGMVRIVPIGKMAPSSDSGAADEIPEAFSSQIAEANDEEMEGPEWDMRNRQLLTIRSFSGPISGLHRGSVPKERVLSFPESSGTEKDYIHGTDTDSVAETDFGSEAGRFAYPGLSSSIESRNRVLSELETWDDGNDDDDDDGSFKNRGHGAEFEGSSRTRMEGIVASEDVGGDVQMHQKNVSVPERDSEHRRDEGSKYLGHLEESIPTEYPELYRGRSWETGETSGIDTEAPDEEEPAKKFTEYSRSSNSAVSHGVHRGKPWDGGMLQEETESTEGKISNGSGVPTRPEPEILCRGLDHADSVGLIKISNRLRHLINWLVNAMLKLRHPSDQKGYRLVKIYGPKIKFDRGAAVAFNLFDWKGELVEPLLVQRLADRNDISLGYAVLQNIWCPEKYVDKMRQSETKIIATTGPKRHPSIAVVTAALGFVTDFEDVYRLWVFVAKFLDADFVIKERWRYRALNQQTVEF